MATLWIREYRDSGAAGAGRPLPIPAEPGTDQSPLTFTTSTASAEFASTTRYIAVYSSAAFHYVVASNPTATTNALKAPADTLIHIAVTPGHKIAAIVAA